MVHVGVRDAGLGEGRWAGDAERARGGEIRHLADHRRLDAFAGADEVGRPLFRPGASFLREVVGALGPMDR
jgi:hypothetical protein